MKKKLVLLLSLALMVALLTGCDFLVQRVTGPILEGELEDPSGPIRELDSAMDELLDELNEDIADQVVQQEVDNDIEDYEWKRTDSNISASVDDPPGSVSGRVTARGVKLDYNFTIIGEAQEEGQEDIVKEDTLSIIIDQIDFDLDQEEIVSVSDSLATTSGEAPDLSNLSYEADPVLVTADVDNITDKSPRAMIVVDNRRLDTDLDIDNNKVEASSDDSVADVFGTVAVINRTVLLDEDYSGTGIAFYLFYF